MTYRLTMSALVSVISRVMVTTADAIALIVSWRQAISIVRSAFRYKTKVSFGEVLIRDGELIFVGVSTLF